MRKHMWFGTRGHERWVPAPAINPDYSRSGYNVRADYLNGGAGIRSSKNAHNAYSLSWNPTKTSEAIRSITDFADGLYDTQDGVNLIYWIDPVAARQNVLNQAWATPSLACEDAPPLITDRFGRGRPDSVPTPQNDHRYPARGARYTLRGDSQTLEQYIPIPPGYSAWVGIHGEEDAAGRLFVRRYNGDSAVGDRVLPEVMGLGPQLVNTKFSSDESSGIVIGISPMPTPEGIDVGAIQPPVTVTAGDPGEVILTYPESSAHPDGTSVIVNLTVPGRYSFTIYAIVVQIIPSNEVPVNGDFVSGQGHSGCQFDGKPSKTPYSAKLDRIGMTARLEETGMYL